MAAARKMDGSVRKARFSRSAAEQFLAEVATFMDSPAGQSMVAMNPKQTLEIIFERAKKLHALT